MSDVKGRLRSSDEEGMNGINLQSEVDRLDGDSRINTRRQYSRGGRGSKPRLHE
ncbi:MAG: hypothetical protein U1D30_09050 [Planctomycetota bacterium]